jgi:hypothetical protein
MPESDPFNPEAILASCMVNTPLGAILQSGRFNSRYRGRTLEFTGTVARLNEAEGLVVLHGGGTYPRNWDVQLSSGGLRFTPGRTYRVEFRLGGLVAMPFSGYSFRGRALDRVAE